MRSKALSMEQCAFPIPEDACLATFLPEEMPTREPVRIPAAGNIPLWRRSVRASISRYMRTSAEPISFNSKDLCMIEHIPEMIEAGIDSFKIEGRMKTALYVATVARTYRKAIDDYLESEEKYRDNMEWYKEEISKCTYSQFTTGFYFGKPDRGIRRSMIPILISTNIFIWIIEEPLKRSQKRDLRKSRRRTNSVWATALKL